jgi:hypothetical protein
MNSDAIREKNRLKMAAHRASNRISPEALAEKRLRLHTSKIKIMSPTEAAYLAGLIDSDGGVFAFMKPNRGKAWPYAALFVTNTNLKMIEWVMNATGAGSLYVSLRENSSHFGVRPMCRWDCGSQQAAVIAEQIKEYVVLKREQIDLLIELASLKRQSTKCHRAEPQRQIEIVGEMQQLNRLHGKTGDRVLLSQLQ